MFTRRIMSVFISAFVASALVAAIAGPPTALATTAPAGHGAGLGLDVGQGPGPGPGLAQARASLQEEPTCRERCERHADEVFLACRARGASIEDCADEARRALAECIRDCEGPAEPTCEEACKENAASIRHACLERGGGEEACEREYREAFAACLRERCPDVPPAEPTCEEACKEHAASIRHACLERGGGEDACEREYREAFAACLRERCPDVPPPAEPGCEDRCEEEAKAARDACLEHGGGGDECERVFRDTFENCVKTHCRPDDPPREPEPTCPERCEIHAREVKHACLESGRSPEECAREAEAALRECLGGCDKPIDPPREPSCEDKCEKEAKAARDACRARGGGEDECERIFRETFDTCVANHCRPDRPPGEPDPAPSCPARCEAHAREIKHACLEGGGSPEDCARKFEEAFRACVAERCDRPAPGPPAEPPSCEKRCQARWEEVFRRCVAGGRGEEECRAAANAERDACLHACERPPAPEPPSCEERCGRYREAVMRACLETGAGEDYCAAEADAARARCLERCTRPAVVSPGRSCGTLCAQLGRLTYQRCIGAGGEAGECQAKARATIDECAGRCERPDPGGRGVIPIDG